MHSSLLSLRLREGAVLVLLVLAGFLSLALLSFNTDDPGWNHIGYEGPVINSTGRAGAWMADLLFTLFGFFAWLIPAVLVIKATMVVRYRYIPWSWSSGLFIIRLTGLLIALGSGAALASLHYHQFDALLPSSSGGIIGQLILKQSLPAFNVTGSTLILMACFLTGATLYTDLSWFKLMDTTGRLTLQSASFLLAKAKEFVTYISEQWAVWRERRAIKKIRAQKERQLPEVGAITPTVVPILEPEPIPAEPSVQLPAPKPGQINQRPSKESQKPSLKELPDGPLPGVTLLDEARDQGKGQDQEILEARSQQLELKLKDFGVQVDVVAVHPGPVITRYEIQPAPGVKASKITNLARDLARSLAVVSVRVVEVIPGKSVMGIEIPNDDRETVYFGEVIASKAFEESKPALSLALGNDIAGQPVVVDLARMPHLLVAGTTGSGKSVGVNAMLLSMLFKSGPEDVRLIMIDPKMLELSIYDGIPHLLSPVVTDMKEAANALRWCVAEMERRYKLMAALGVRNIAGYNRKVKEGIKNGEPLRDPFFQPLTLGEPAPELDTLPFIVVVVDEFADMMMIVGKKVEELIARIAQKARAAGIHLILATQRPSVDVITGLIKANVPTRISFQVSSKIDSRTIIDQGGAEQLLGHGDMLYLPPGTSVPIRVHGAFVSDDEVHRVVADWKKRGEPDYVDEVLSGVETSSDGSAFSGGLDADSEKDPLYDEVVAFVTESRRVSISSVQRKFKIGYNRSANIIEAMESAGVIGPMGNNGSREVIAPPPPKA